MGKTVPATGLLGIDAPLVPRDCAGSTAPPHPSEPPARDHSEPLIALAGRVRRLANDLAKHTPATPAERRRTFLLVRSVLIIAAAALTIMQSQSPLPLSRMCCIIGALASNVALARTPPRYFFEWWVQAGVLLADTVWIAFLLLSAGCGQQLFVFYFIELFLAAISESLGLLALGAVLIGTASIIVGGGAGMTETSLIRVPFLFAAALFYGYVVDITKAERHPAAARGQWAQQLEREVRARTEELERQSGELRRLYQHIVEGDRLKSEFVSNISHELRSPLSHILGYTDLALEDPDLPAESEARRFIVRVAASARALHRLVESILQYASFDRGRATVLPTQFSADRVLLELRALCNDVPRSANVTVRVGTAPGLEFNTDFDRLHSILRSLLLNALKFTQNGAVELTARAQGDEVEFCVCDTGVGIPADQLAHIFEPFRQVDGSVTRQYGGVGLGLALVRRNLDLLRARIEVESLVGVGSIFRVYVPRHLDPHATGKPFSQ